jgi:hypothetical protein
MEQLPEHVTGTHQQKKLVALRTKNERERGEDGGKPSIE